MVAKIVNSIASSLPEDDDHPYRTGAWRPNHREWDAYDLEVEGEIPDDLEGVYLRNTENPVHPSIGLYHPFDGDGMLHQIAFGDGGGDLPQPLRAHRRAPCRGGGRRVPVGRHSTTCRRTPSARRAGVPVAG